MLDASSSPTKPAPLQVFPNLVNGDSISLIQLKLRAILNCSYSLISYLFHPHCHSTVFEIYLDHDCFSPPPFFQTGPDTIATFPRLEYSNHLLNCLHSCFHPGLLKHHIYIARCSLKSIWIGACHFLELKTLQRLPVWLSAKVLGHLQVPSPPETFSRSWSGGVLSPLCIHRSHQTSIRY